MRPIKYIVLIILFSCSVESEKQEYADFLIKEIKSYEEKTNRLPKNTSELGLIEKEDSKAFYQLETDSSYIVWYGLGIGESKVYSSINKTWK